MKYVIDRTKWLRGEGYLASCLLRTQDGKMCCWGFVCHQHGIHSDQMADITAIYNLPSGLDKMSEFMHVNTLRNFDGEKEWVKQCYGDNDDPEISDDEREKLLADEFKAHGHELEFIN